MVKAKKGPKKVKNEEPSNTEEEVVDNIEAKTEDESEKTSQENGEVDVALKKGKGKGKATKKEDSDEKDEDEESAQENGEDGSGDKKKVTQKKAKASKKETKPATEPARKSSRTPKPVEKEEGAYEVEKLVDFRIRSGKPQFLIRWKGYSKADDTWEDESGLNCPDLLQKYKEDHPTAGSKGKKRSAAKSPSKSPKKAKKQEPEDYEVEEVVGLRLKSGKREFKIRWKGYKPSDDTWEPEKHLSCQDLIEKYLEEHKDDVQELEEKAPVKKAKPPSKGGKKGKKSKSK